MTQGNVRNMKLVLEDGSVYPGFGLAADREVVGEVVFNTGMTGYVESFSDPSYTGQILVTTYPLIGNYGVPPTPHADPLDGPLESDGVKILGLVASEVSPGFHHHRSRRTLESWLSDAQVPGLTGVDTRCLTRKLREHGTMRGKLAPLDADDRLPDDTVEMKDAVARVSCREPSLYPGSDLTVLLVDCGAKLNIIRHLQKRGLTVRRVPWNADLSEEAQGRYDGVVLSNGPGDPKDAAPLVAQVRALLARNKPVFGICLGNQIVALACGADTYKLKYGHRSQNQPCQDLFSRRCVITSQNHGYAVREESLPPDWDTWFVNINDGTNEGIRHRHKPFFSVQFHPEAAPGPVDTEFLFDDFARILTQNR